jgi:hypothetical protein
MYIIQHNDTRHTDTQYNDTQQNDSHLEMKLSITTVSTKAISVMDFSQANTTLSITRHSKML